MRTIGGGGRGARLRYDTAVIASLLIPRFALGLLLIGLLLLAGQLGQLAPLLRQAGAIDWGGLLAAAGGILLEPALPLACLFATGASYGALRADGAWDAAVALGHRPLALLRPAIALGALVALVAAGLAHGAVPRWIAGLRVGLVAGLEALPPGASLPIDGGVARVGPDGSLHATVDGTYLRAASAGLVQEAEGWRLVARDAWLWSRSARIRVGEARLALDRGRAERRLGQLGPPNSVPTADLAATAHHRFVAARRSALPSLALGWALLGAILGVRLGGRAALLAGAGCVGITYWILRIGELNARAELVPPWFAAWAPAALTALVACLGLARMNRSG